jgi:hypothetical protein
MKAEQNPDLIKVRTVPWWVGPAFAILSACAVPWVVFLAITLPRRATFAHYRGVWVGFDTGLILVLALTALLAWLARPQVALAATAASTMLLVDAWFDMMTTPRSGFWISVLLAGLVELPLAAVCLWIALHAAEVIENRVALLAARTRGSGRSRPGKP